MNLKLTKRDRAIIAHCLVLSPSAELGDRIGGNDGKTLVRRYQLAELFDPTIKQELLSRHK